MRIIRSIIGGNIVQTCVDLYIDVDVLTYFEKEICILVVSNVEVC